MDKRNSKGVTALKILQNAATRIHYEYLQNSSRLIAYLGKKAVRLGVGTTRNEQLHHELTTWMRNIRMSHLTRFYICIRIFLFLKLVTHSSASYSPTLIQTSQARLIHTIAGDIRHNALFPVPLRTAPFNTNNQSGNINTPHVLLAPNVAKKRSSKRKLQSIMWSKNNIVARDKQLHKTNIFRRPRASKEHTWTPKK